MTNTTWDDDEPIFSGTRDEWDDDQDGAGTSADFAAAFLAELARRGEQVES